MSENSTETLYQKRVPIHPRSVKGTFRRFKTSMLVLAYSVFFLLPWVRWERTAGPDQAVMFDIPGRRYYLFDLIVHPQDMFWLAGFLIIAAWFLFFITGVVGRAFCGYFCFQTLWTDFFMKIERWVQGERPARLRLEKSPWNLEKIGKKGLTWLLWLAVAFWTGFTFTAYWADAPALFVDFIAGNAHSAAYTTTFILTGTTFLAAGLLREQVCIYMCPYSRFQTVMFDKETLIVSYDKDRGEGSAGRHRVTKDYKTREERQEKGVGDCIDCGMCVQVCPTGIDIREGLQIGCITCGLCIDACDQIMESRGWPKGLVRYASEKELEEGVKPKVLKLKTLGYGAAILAVTVLLFAAIITKAPMDFAVNQVRNPLFVTLADGRIQNSYEIKINNKTDQPQDLDLSIEGLPGAELELVGNIQDLHVKPDDNLNVLVRVKYDAEKQTGQREINFVVKDESGDIPNLTQPAMFYISR